MNNPMLWVGYPRSYTAGRNRPVQFVTLHYTAGSEGPTSAEGGANYDKNRTDGTSCHAFFDSQGPGLQEVPFGDRSHSAYFHGNEIGVHYEICGTIQTRAQWLDATSMATLRTCAQATYYACEALGLQLRRLSVAETRAAYYGAPGQRPKGINDHATITAAFPEDPGNHTDVGTAFPWDIFMGMVLSFGGSTPTPTPQEDEMTVKLLAPKGPGVYAKDGVVMCYPTDLGMALETVRTGDLNEMVKVYGSEIYVKDARAYGTPIEELVKKWVAMGGTGVGGSGLSFEDTVKAAREGANLAEDS